MTSLEWALRSRLAAACLVAGCAVGGTPDAGSTTHEDAGGDVMDAFVPQEDATIPQEDASAPDARVPMDAGSASVGAPVVDGEPRADHPQPSWTWTVPEGAAGFRVRIDDGAYEELDVSTTVFTSPSALADGEHRFAVSARDASGRYGPEGTFDTTVALIEREGDWWWRADRVMATSPLGHPAAISAHNAYDDDLNSADGNLTETLRILHAAQTAGADLLELDLVDVGGTPRIEHDDTGSAARARLEDVLDDAAIGAGDQILFLEIKETTPNEAFLRRILDLFAARRDSYARAGRPVVLRAFHARRAALELARTLLDSPEYVLLRPYVRLSVLFGRDEATRALVGEAASSGYDMIELEYRTADWPTYAALARSLGLGVNIWTVPPSVGEVYIANAREIADAITVDYPIGAARAVVTDDNSLFYVNVREESDASASSVSYLQASPTPSTMTVNGAGEPLLRVGASSFVGGRLAFEPAAMRSAALYDADVRAGEGVLLALTVRFATLTLPDGATMSVLAKTNSAAYGLELSDAAGAAGTLLRFAVYVGGAYHYATIPTSALTTTRPYFITCAYDGDGGVRMWIDNDESGVTTTTTTGGITNNDVPVVLGADPQGSGATRFFFDGEIQMALAQTWGAH